MCIDYQKVKSLKQIHFQFFVSMINQIGQAKYVTKFDLLKRFWQILMADRANAIQTFVTPACYCIVLLFYVHGKQLRSCRDGQLT